MEKENSNVEKRTEDGAGALVDSYGRTMDYLRISLTDRCNLRCRYCMPKEGIPAFKHEDIMTLEEVYRVAEVMTGMGIRRIRLTGGEPLVRKNMLSLVRRLGELPSKPELSLTTNGVLLEDYLEELSEAGVGRINISLDTRNPETYRELTGVDALDKVERALDKAVSMKLQVKLNCVPIIGINDGELTGLAEIAAQSPVDVRFIELMPIGCAKGFKGINRESILSELERAFGGAEKDMPEVGSAGITAVGPSEYYRFKGFMGRIGFISPMSHAFCAKCNRLRLTADGRLKLCLYYPDGPALLPMLRSGISDGELREKILQSLKNKPERHYFGDKEHTDSDARNMIQIGG